MAVGRERGAGENCGGHVGAGQVSKDLQSL